MRSACLPMAAGLAALSVASAATAQIWIGQVAANAIRAQQEYEARCHTLYEIPPAYVEPVAKQGRTLLARYLTLANRGDRKGLAALFVRRKGAAWRAPGQSGDPRDLSDPYVVTNLIEMARIEQRAFEVGRDWISARGIFVVSLPDPADSTVMHDVTYAIDFVANDAGTTWYLYHVAVYPGPDEPVRPTPFCHLKETENY